MLAFVTSVLGLAFTTHAVISGMFWNLAACSLWIYVILNECRERRIK